MLRTFILIAVFGVSALWAKPVIEVIESAHGTTVQSKGNVLWTYHHDPAEGKPYFHPLNTNSGDRLSELRPKDHPWHRGLWFSWKYINGVNYWEEDRETGQSDGRTRLLSTERDFNDKQQVTIHQRLEYAPGEAAAAVLGESRTLVITPPNASGDYVIDWASEFRALHDVDLGRTPIIGESGGKSYGGYAGLSIRLSKSDVGGAFLGPDAKVDPQGIQNFYSKWMIWNTAENESVLMMDHPDNLRAPTKWYLAPTMPYFSPAVLFDAPHGMAKGETLLLRYRVVVSAEKMTVDQAASLFREWTDSAKCCTSGI